MLKERGILRIGMEIEVVDWKGRTYHEVCADLIRNDYMMGPEDIWKEHHNYHCACEKGGCERVRRGDVMVPPLVSMTYDASLPATGAEFIVSPILLMDEVDHVSDLLDVWKIVTNKAVWARDRTNWHGNGMCSPSIHLHVSAMRPQGELMQRFNKALKEDIFHALSLFAPEFFALADTTDVRRGVKYRLPTRKAVYQDENDHHGFIDVRAVNSDFVYVEWRLFEAAYDDWDYVMSGMYLAAAMTRAFLDPSIVSRLMRAGYEFPYDPDDLDYAVTTDDAAFILERVNVDRFLMLRSVCLEQLDDDDYGYALVDTLFGKAKERLGIFV